MQELDASTHVLRVGSKTAHLFVWPQLQRTATPDETSALFLALLSHLPERLEATRANRLEIGTTSAIEGAPRGNRVTGREAGRPSAVAVRRLGSQQALALELVASLPSRALRQGQL